MTAFLFAVSAALLIGLVLVLAWALSRERYYEQLLETRESQYAEALKREGELSAQSAKLLEEQAHARLRLQAMEGRHRLRGELIRDLGLDPERFEHSRGNLLGVLAVLRIRIGLVLVSEVNKGVLRDVADTAGGRAAQAYQQLDERLRGEGAAQHDQQSRQLLREMLDVNHLGKPVPDHHEPMV